MRRFFEPATAPPWLKPVLSSIRAALGDVWDAPVRPFQMASAALPPAVDHEGGLVYDTTLGQLRYSDAASWLTLVDTGGAAFTGNVPVGGTFGVAGNATLGGNVAVTGNLSCTGNATLGDAAGDVHVVNGSVGFGGTPTAFQVEVVNSAANLALRSTGTAAASFRGLVNGAEAGKVAFLNGGGIDFEVAGVSKGTWLASGLSVTGNVTGTQLIVNHASQPILNFQIGGVSNAQIVGATSAITYYADTQTWRSFASALRMTLNSAGLSVVGALSANAPTGAAGFTNVNAGNQSSTTALNPGVMVYNDGTSVYGMYLGHDGANYATRIFAPAVQKVQIGLMANSPTGHGDFTRIADISGNGLSVSGEGTFARNQNATTTLAVVNTDTTNATSRAQVTISGGSTSARWVALSGSIVAFGTTTASDIQFQRNAVVIATVAAGALDIASGSVLRMSGTQVLTTRRTGWGAPTGTATRSTFATGSVTTAHLAERVKALIDDLAAHGLIGA